jgi:hypothetical protein
MPQKPAPKTFRRWLSPLLFVPILALLTLCMWGLSSPVGSSPDDDFHLASIWCAAGPKADACADAPQSDKRVVPQDFKRSECFAFHPKRSAACQGADFGDSPALGFTTDHGNFAGLYPPVFYATMSVFVRSNLEVSVLLMRLANSLIFVALATALFFLVPRVRRPTVVWSFLVVLVPLGLFLIPSTNPSGWAIISAGILWLSLVGYFETTGKRRVGLGLLALVATVLGAGARADSAVYCGIAVIAAVILTLRRGRGYLVSALLPLGVIIVSILFYLSASQSTVGTTGLSTAHSGHQEVVGLTVKNLLAVPKLWAQALGSGDLGWLDTPMPPVVGAASAVAFVTALVLGIAVGGRRKYLAVLLVVAALWLIPTFILVQSQVSVGSLVQARYIYPLIVLLGGILLFGVTRYRGGPKRVQLVIVIVGLAVAQSVALHTNILRYTLGLDEGGLNLDSHVEWWWSFGPSPLTTWLIGSVAFAVLLLAVSSSVLFPRRFPANLADEHPIDDEPGVRGSERLDAGQARA